MLILTRRANEKIFIGEDIVLVVLGIENNRVKLGLQAPNEVPILREEIISDALKAKHDLNSVSKSNGKQPAIKTGTG